MVIDGAIRNNDTSNMDKIVAHNIKKLREIAQYTQDEMAHVLGITPSDYISYESGDREIPYNVIESVSDFFDCDMTMLFEDNAEVDAMILAPAFRLDGMTTEDAVEIMRFKDIVKSYLKMEAIEAHR